MGRVVFCVLIFISSFCTLSHAEENWLRLRTLFGEGSPPSEASLKLHQKWSCTDGFFYIFSMQEAKITAYTNSGQVSFLFTPKELKQISKRNEITSVIRASGDAGNLIVELTLPNQPFHETLPLALSDENQRSIGYVECLANHVSPLLKEEAVRFTGQTLTLPHLMIAISEKELADYEQQLSQRHHAISFQKALAATLQSYVTDDHDWESPLAVVQTKKPNTENINLSATERLRNYLNHKDTLLTLLPLEETAPHGEDPSDYWIFVLSIRELSDHQFFAVYNPENQRVYNYGFN